MGFTHLSHSFRVVMSAWIKEKTMKHLEGFVAAGEVVADERARIAFGKAGVRRDDRYAIAVNDDGEILLTPLVSIPKRELVVWENQLVRQELAEGLRQSAAGEVVDLGSFAEFADDEIDEEDDEAN
ncbi:hypothetical protein [Microbacterium sp. K41]|uniref:hypothetical protein n=1 Tax=Microbacterium sp. K41 TaxID=2305437 RepID=UPI001F0DBF9F|nr:hypothetical protein [Microbacterium sp. K41]